MSTPDPTRAPNAPLTLERSRVVARVLKQHILEDHLMRTLGLWRREYEHQREPALFEFMGRVKHRLRDQRTETMALQAIWEGFHQINGASPTQPFTLNSIARPGASKERCQKPDDLLDELARVIESDG